MDPGLGHMGGSESENPVSHQGSGIVFVAV